MTGWFDLAMMVVVLTGLMTLGSGRLSASIRNTAVQGVAVNLFPVLMVGLAGAPLHLVAMSVFGLAFRGGVFPFLLMRALRDTETRREAAPFVGYIASAGAGVLFVVLGFWLGRRLNLPGRMEHVFAVALATVLNGLFIIVSRRLAINQVLGYITMENGIYLMGLSLFHEIPWLVELGVLLDLFVAVLVMGLFTFHIHREFEHTQVDRLNRLKG